LPPFTVSGKEKIHKDIDLSQNRAVSTVSNRFGLQSVVATNKRYMKSNFKVVFAKIGKK